MKTFPFFAATTLLSVWLTLSGCGETPEVMDEAAGKETISPRPAAVPEPKEKISFDEGKVAQLVGRILQEAHFSQKPFDAAVSRLFLKGYIDALDYGHMIFLQTDLDEFTAKYGDTLDQYTKKGDVSPGQEIFKRFIQRLDQRGQWVETSLKQTFDFTKDETYLADRSKAPWPANEAGAKELWHKRIKFEILQGRLIGEKSEETIKNISRRYTRLLKSMHEMDEEDVIMLYLSGLTHAYDPHSDYQSPREAKNFEITTIKLSLTGIGAELKSDDGYVKVVRLVPGGPADLDKRLKPNDRVVAVAQDKGEPVNVIDMRLNKVVDMIRGERGTKVTLTVIPADAADASVRHEVTLTRDEIKLADQKAKARIIERPSAQGLPERLGVLTLEPGFYDDSKGSSAAADTARLVKRMMQEGITGLIIDLRRNGGGLLEQAIEFTSLFVKEGPVVQAKDQRGRIQAYRIQGDKQIYTGPLIVLTSRLSASAAEIVAAALQDYGRAIVVGDKSTHGKGTVQTLVSLKDLGNWGADEDPGRLKITVQKFYRIAGGTTQLHGVEPDIALPSLNDYLDIGESTLPNALPGDEIPPVRFQHISTNLSLVPELQKRSTARIAQSKDFAYLLEDIETLKKRNADKNISLNEATRKVEKTDADARKSQRDKERAARPVAADKVYVLDLDSVAAQQPLKPWTPPVPAPDAKTKPEAKKPSTDDDAPEPDTTNPYNQDIHLLETINILHDYISLLSKPAGALVDLKGNKPES